MVPGVQTCDKPWCCLNKLNICKQQINYNSSFRAAAPVPIAQTLIAAGCTRWKIWAIVHLVHRIGGIQRYPLKYDSDNGVPLHHIENSQECVHLVQGLDMVYGLRMSRFSRCPETWHLFPNLSQVGFSFWYWTLGPHLTSLPAASPPVPPPPSHSQQSIKRPIDQPTNQSTNQSINQPTNQPINQSTNQPINQLTNHQPINQSINRWTTNRSINQSTNQSTNQPTNQPINQSTSQPINQSTNQSIKHSTKPNDHPITNQPTNQPINQSSYQSIDLAINQSINKLKQINQLLRKFIHIGSPNGGWSKLQIPQPTGLPELSWPPRFIAFPKEIQTYSLS